MFNLLHFVAKVGHISFELLEPDVNNIKARINHFELSIQQFLEIVLQVVKTPIGFLLAGFRQIVHRHNQRNYNSEASEDCGVDCGIHVDTPSIVPHADEPRSGSIS